MNKLYLLVFVALICQGTFGKSFRLKRQTADENTKDIEDRYGWSSPGQFPNQNQLGSWQGGFPPQGGWMYPQGQYPWQYPGQNWPQPGPYPMPYPGPYPVPYPGLSPGQGQNPGRLPEPGQNPGQIPDQGQNPGTVVTSTLAPTTTVNTAISGIALADCILRCPSTAEYNPVCGSDNQTYDNPGRLLCAQSCGANIVQLRASRCPAPAPAA